MKKLLTPSLPALVLLCLAPAFPLSAQEGETAPADVKPVPVPAPADASAGETSPTGVLEPVPVSDAWTTDYQSARKRAIAEKKDLLLVFTASDWIKICQIYDRDIINQKAFTDLVEPKFVPVRFDFPKHTSQSPSLRAQNNLFMQAYRVTGFPTLMLTDTEGRPYAVNGYQPITPEEYGKIVLAMEETRVQRDEMFAQAAKAEGIEKAKLLVKAVPRLPGNLAARYYRPQLDEIIASDPGNETKAVPHLQKMIADVDYSNRMREMSSKVEWSKMIELTNQYITENQLAGAEKQKALFNKVGVYQKQGRTADLIATLLEIVKIDEKTPHGQRAQGILDRFRAEKLQEEMNAPARPADQSEKSLPPQPEESREKLSPSSN